MTIEQGDIVYVNLEPSKGNEMRKTRPCLVVSNNDYNKYFNTTLVLPISSSKKYLEQEKYLKSPIFVSFKEQDVHGTVLLQHVRAVDLKRRQDSKVVGHLSQEMMNTISDTLKQFF